MLQIIWGRAVRTGTGYVPVGSNVSKPTDRTTWRVPALTILLLSARIAEAGLDVTSCHRLLKDSATDTQDLDGTVSVMNPADLPLTCKNLLFTVKLSNSKRCFTD